MWVLARYSRGKQELGSFSDYQVCVLWVINIVCGEVRGQVVWCGLGNMEGEVGTKVKGEGGELLQGGTQEACLIPAPSDVLLLFQLLPL